MESYNVIITTVSFSKYIITSCFFTQDCRENHRAICCQTDACVDNLVQMHQINTGSFAVLFSTTVSKSNSLLNLIDTFSTIISKFRKLMTAGQKRLTCPA